MNVAVIRRSALMTKPIAKCPFCHAEAPPDRNGDCQACHRNIVDIKKDPLEQLQFYCVVCNEFFFSCRDDTGYDQAPCPECGDLSNTTDFFAGEHARNQDTNTFSLYLILKIAVILFLSGLGWAIISNLF